MANQAVTWWCSHHEALVSAEHWFQCRFTRPPQAIHFHPASAECVVAAWAEIAAAFCLPPEEKEWRAEYLNEPN